MAEVVFDQCITYNYGNNSVECDYKLLEDYYEDQKTTQTENAPPVTETPNYNERGNVRNENDEDSVDGGTFHEHVDGLLAHIPQFLDYIYNTAERKDDKPHHPLALMVWTLNTHMSVHLTICNPLFKLSVWASCQHYLLAIALLYLLIYIEIFIQSP